MTTTKKQRRTYKVRSAYNDSGNNPGTTFSEPSLTVPSQALPLKKLLELHTRGIPMPAMRNPIFEKEDEPALFGGINAKTLDLVDLQEIKENVQSGIQDYEDAKKTYIGRKNEAARLASEKAKQEADKLAKQTKETGKE